MKKDLSVSAFAKLCGVTKHTLYYYEEEGLFKPAYVSEKGYRYYAYRQYDRFRFIQTLRALGISVDSIRAYLQVPDEGIEEVLVENIRRIEDEIRKMDGMKKYMEQLVSRSRAIKSVHPGEVFIEEMPEMKIRRSGLLKKAYDYEQGQKAYVKFCHEHHVDAGRIHGEQMRLENIRNKHYFEYDHVFMSVDGTEGGNGVIEAGNYLCVYYCGDYEQCYEGYEMLIEEAGKRGLTLDTYGYEIYITNNILVKDDDAQITKIFARIR